MQQREAKEFSPTQKLQQITVEEKARNSDKEFFAFLCQYDNIISLFFHISFGGKEPMPHEPYLGRDLWSEDWEAVFPNTDSTVVKELHILRNAQFALNPAQERIEDLLPVFSHILPPLGKIIYRSRASVEPDSRIEITETLEEILRDSYGSDMVKRLGEERVKALVQILWESGGVLFRRKIVQMSSGLPANYGILLSSNFRVCVYYFLGSALLGDSQWNSLFDLLIRCFLWGNPPLQKTPKNEFVVVTC